MELVFVVAGIVLIWKFSGAISAAATSAKVKAEVMSEEVIAESVQQRTENFERFQEEMEGKTVVSHEEVMKFFKVD